MGIFKFKGSSNINPAVPAVYQEPAAYVQGVKINGQLVKSSLHKGSSGGKLTSSIVEAMCRAVMITAGATDAFGANGEYSVAEITDSQRFEGVDVGSGASILMAVGISGPNKGHLFASCNGQKADDKQIHTWHVMLALMGYYMTNQEFEANFRVMCDATATNEQKLAAAAICADVAYYMTDTNIGLNMDELVRNNIGNLTPTAAGTKKFAPDIYRGVFKTFSPNGRNSTTSKKTSAFIKPADWNGKYRLVEESFFTEEEKALIPVLDNRYVIPQEVDNMAAMIKWGIDRKQRVNFNNIFLRSEPGYGKSTIYVLLAAAFGLPLHTIALNAMSEPMDLVGSFVPIEGDMKSTRELAGGKIPSPSDMSLDPVWAYKEITGKDKPDATEADCISAVMAKAASNTGEDSKTRVKFVPGIIPAMARPCMIGLDEVSMPMNAGVVPTLNPLLDDTNAYTLPTGEVVKRHPLTILVSTTNIGQAGNHAINPAFMNRHGIILDLEAPTKDELKKRLIANTGFKPKDYPNLNLDDFLRAYSDLQSVASRRRLTDGTIGPRNLSHWLSAAMAIGSPRKAAEMTIIPGATADTDAKADLREKVEAIFPN